MKKLLKYIISSELTHPTKVSKIESLYFQVTEEVFNKHLSISKRI